MKRIFTLLILSLTTLSAQAQDSAMLSKISTEILLHGTCYSNLRVLCKQIGHRLSGTPQAAKAVTWAENALRAAGADTVWLQPVMVPKWVRGRETLELQYGSGNFAKVPMLSLGNTVGTDGKPLLREVIMVKTFDEFKKLTPQQVKGKIVFFNYRFRQDLVNTFVGYGDAGPYRWQSPNLASAKGAAAVIIRSISTGYDDEPHTGSLRYADTVKPIPAVAIGNHTADKLEAAFEKGTGVNARLTSNCKMDGTVLSYNVIGELRGSRYPNRYVVVGGHLDSWDVGEGAHDDGAGCVQSIEVIRTMKALHIRPKNTVRCVLFMNEENGLKGGMAYADSAKARNEQHIFAIETDAGGFSPRGLGLDMEDVKRKKIQRWRGLFLPYGIYNFEGDEGGADISPLHRQGVPVAGLLPDPQRYFDLHHTHADVFEAVNHRELKMGAFALTALVYLVAEHGL